MGQGEIGVSWLQVSAPGQVEPCFNFRMNWWTIWWLASICNPSMEFHDFHVCFVLCIGRARSLARSLSLRIFVTNVLCIYPCLWLVPGRGEAEVLQTRCPVSSLFLLAGPRWPGHHSGVRLLVKPPMCRTSLKGSTSLTFLSGESRRNLGRLLLRGLRWIPGARQMTWNWSLNSANIWDFEPVRACWCVHDCSCAYGVYMHSHWLERRTSMNYEHDSTEHVYL